MDKNLLELLADPLNPKVPLKIADKDTVAKINSLIAKGKLKNRAGNKLDTPIIEALIDDSGKHLYPVINGIPLLIADKVIDIETLTD